MAKKKKCPVCGVPVKIENLQDHIQKVHPRADVDIDYSEEEVKEIKKIERREKQLVTGTGIVYAVVVVAVMAAVLGAALLLPQQNIGPGEGQEAPNFSLPTTTGSTMTLSDYRGRIVLLDLMDTDCGVCPRHTQQHLVPLYERYQTRVVFLSVDVNIIGDKDTFEDIVSFKEMVGSSWEYSLDDGTVVRAYGVTSTPRTLIIDRDGIIRYTEVGGGATFDKLSSKLDELLG